MMDIDLRVKKQMVPREQATTLESQEQQQTVILQQTPAATMQPKQQQQLQELAAQALQIHLPHQQYRLVPPDDSGTLQAVDRQDNQTGQSSMSKSVFGTWDYTIRRSTEGT